MPLGIGLPPPPRFGNREGPQTPADWSAVWRWLTQVYQVLTTVVSVPLAFALQQNRGRGGGGGTGAVALYVTHTDRIANYSAASYAPGQLLEESDTGYQYVGNASDWIWQSGLILDASSTLAGLPSWLTSTDVNAAYRNSHFGRKWEWDGSAWNYADGGVPAGSQISTSGATPQGGLWVACDGGSYTGALNDATLGTVTANDTRVDIHGNNPAIMGGAGGPQQVATPATWDASAKTDDENAHTHSVTIAATGTATLPVAGTDFAQAQTVTSGPGSAHHHVLSDANALLNAPSDTDGGMPLRVSMKWWLRL